MNALEFRLQREEFTTESTVGRLFFRLAPTDSWTWLCWTLEDVVREPAVRPLIGPLTYSAWVRSWKVPGKTALPRGTYDLVVTRSNRFSRKAGHDVFLPLILDTPGFVGARFHGGNDADDTDGCTLVAHHHPRPDFIQGTAIAEVLAILATCGNSGMITICDKEQP